MAIRVKDLAGSASRWASRAGGAAGEYSTEAQAAGERWASNTGASAQTYFQAVSSAGIQDRFRRGVQRAGASKYTRKIADVGQSRYSTGVQAAIDDWRAGFEPFASTIAGLTLPPRRPRGDPGNIERVRVIASALNARRLAALGSTT